MKLRLWFFVFLLAGCFQTKQSFIQKGVLDLSRVDFSYNLIVKLDGEWKFYWKQLPEDIRTSKKETNVYSVVPSRWNKNIFKREENLGYATYELEIINNFNEDYLSLYIPVVLNAYEIYTNYEKVFSLGKVSLEPEGFIPQNYPARVNIPGKPRNILLQVVVYDQIFGEGGIDEPILLSSTRNIKSYELFLNSLDSFIVGFLFCIAIFHLLHYSLDTSKKAFLFFGICVILIAIRELLADQKILVALFQIPLLKWYRVDTAIKFLILGYFAKFTQTLYPDEFPKNFSKVLLRITLILSLLSLFLSYYLLFLLDVFIRVSVPVIGTYFIYKIYLAYKNNRPDSGIYITLFLIFAVIATNDILYSFKLLNTGYYLVYGYFFFFVTQSFIIVRQNTRAFFELQTFETRLRKISKVKDDFMANLSHELRTPLSLIYAFSELILDKNYKDIETLRSYGEDIHREAKYLIEIINDLMLITDLETKTSLYLRNCSLKELLEEAIDYLESFRIEKNITIELAGSENTKLFCDRSIILKVFISVIKNSLLYNKQDGNVKITWKVNEHKKVHIQIQDTGFGIPKKDIPFVFDKFYRVDNSMTYKVSGVGVGLFLAKKSVELHEGDVYVDSELGNGTTVNILLPVSKN